MSIASNAARLIKAHGETMTLKRDGEGATISLKGKRIQGGTEGIGGSAVHQEFRVKIATVELLASAWSSKVPVRTDSIVIGGIERSVLDVRPLYDGDTLALYELTVAG